MARRERPCVAFSDRPTWLSSRYIRGARFTPDGRNIVYSAMWEERPYEVFTARIGDHTARALGMNNAMVLSVAADGTSPC